MMCRVGWCVCTHTNIYIPVRTYTCYIHMCIISKMKKQNLEGVSNWDDTLVFDAVVTKAQLQQYLVHLKVQGMM